MGFSALRDSSGQIIGGFRTGYLTDYRTEFTAYSGELQHIWQRDAHTVVVGGRYQAGEADHTVTLPTAQRLESDLRRLSAYGYYYWRVAEPLLLQAGVSYDKLDYPENVSLVPFTTKSVNQDKVSPKAGFYYTPLAGTTLRGSYSRSLGGVFYDGSVRLEPTQLGGFNQAFRSVIPESVVGLVPGTAFETFGLAVDQKFGQGTYVSVAGEVLQSRADRAVGVYTLTFGPPEATSTSESLRFRERSVAVTVNQLLGKHWSAGATYRLTDADLQEQFGELTPALRATADRDVAATLHQVNLFVLVQLPCGFFAGGNTLWSKQSNRGYSGALPGDNFWQQNVYAGYRFWQRRAELKLALLNVSDQDYQLNPLTLYHELPRERTLLASLKFYF